MKKIIIVCGLIGGLIVSSLMLFSIAFYKGQLIISHAMWFGYASMILAFSLIFVAVKNYRDNYQGGQISFWKAIQIGLLITAIASTMYVGVWLVEYYCFAPDFMEKYAAQMVIKMKAAGATAAAIKQKTVEMAAFSKMYRNPFFNACMTYCEILPVGVIMSLLAGVILMRRSNSTAVFPASA